MALHGGDTRRGSGRGPRGRPGELTQADIDAWHATAANNQKQGARSFLTWAMTARHIPTLQLPQIRFNKGEAITQYRRLALLRRYLTDDRVPLRIRVIACLMLLYAQPLSRILRLITSDITHDEYGQTWICFGHPPAPVPFAYVVTSPAPRAIETAIAMGFAVDDTLDLPSGYVPGQASHHDQWNWPRPYLTYARLIHSSQDVAAATQAHRAHWARAAQAVPQGAALVISH
jgi:hypothetical protein